MPIYKDKTLYERMIDRHGTMKNMREPWEKDSDNIISIFRPDLVRFSRKDMDTKRKILGANIHEGTGPWAVRLMADGIQGNLVSQSIDWIRYQVEEDHLRGNDEINKWLQDLEDHMLSVYRKSNFYESLGPYCRHGLTVGSPVILPEYDEKTGRIKCIVPHPAERFLMQNVFGETDVLHFRSEWTIRNAVHKFGKENFSETIQNSYENGRDDEKVTIIRGIYYYLDRIFKDLPDKQLKVTENEASSSEEQSYTTFKPRWPWVSIYIEEGKPDDRDGTKEPLKIEGYWSKPYSVWHYEKDHNEVYARTPAWMAYYDVMSANQSRKSLIMAGQKSVERAWWVPDWLKTKFKTYPRGMNWFSPGQATLGKPEPLDEKINYPFGVDLEERFVKTIERWFHVRMWMMLSIWSEEQKAPPTATQINQMMGEKSVLLGPRVGGFTRNLEEIDSRFMDIEDRRGTLPVKPDILLEESSGEIRPEFIGPLAQTQKQYHSSRRTQTALAEAEIIFAADPLVRHKIKWEVLLERTLEENKFFQDAIRSDDEYQEILNGLAQQEAIKEGIAMGGEVAKAIPSVSKDIEPNSPLALLGAGAA